jgi:hypothetical protein
MTAINDAGGTTAVTTSPQVNAFLEAYSVQPATGTPVTGGDVIDLTETVDRMHVEYSPFTYGIIDEFLPKAIYDAILREWPVETEFGRVEMSAAPEATELGSRRVLLIEDTSDPDRVPAAGVWHRVADALRAPSFVRGLFARFADVIDTNLATLGDVTAKTPIFRLNRCHDHGEKDALQAHLDAAWKLLTIVVYLDLRGAVNEDSEQLWGTSLYHTEAGAVRPLLFTPNADHELAARVGFVPNRAFVMPNSSNALHGVAGGQVGVHRRTLMCGYRLGDS